MASINNLCQRGVLLDAGKVKSEGSASEMVQIYLSESNSASGQVVWTDPLKAPGNDVVRLHAVRILQEGIEGPAVDVDISKEVQVEISYWNFRDRALLYPAIHLKDKMRTVVLSSSNHNSISLFNWFFLF